MVHNFKVTGLTDAAVEASRKRHGTNTTEKPERTFWPAVRDIIFEPMFILLVATSFIYFLLGETNEGFFMVVAILMVSAISFFQDNRSRKALKSLKAFTQTQARVLRNGKVIDIPSEEIVMDDFVVVEEGTLIPADGVISQCNDFMVNESILTGESFAVSKDTSEKNNIVFHGTTVISGLALFQVTAIGGQTKLGKIGKSLEEIIEEKTPLQQQINTFVKRMAVAGIIIFLMIWIYNFIRSGDLLQSLLKGLTLAMSILPEEIPVAFTTFMALGAWRLMKQGVIVKKIKTVETLGSATVICTDKTGTITENEMELVQIYSYAAQKTSGSGDWHAENEKKVIEIAMWASEPVPFDPMEKALHEAYSKYIKHDSRINAAMLHEYPLSGKPPMMTHIFKTVHGDRIIAAKGAPESIIKYSSLKPEEVQKITDAWSRMTEQGYRVLGVAEATHEGAVYPKEQQEFSFHFVGLVAFYDPPKQNISEVLRAFYKAGIEVKIITGDNEKTTASIARQINFKGSDITIDGEQLMEMNDAEFKKAVNRSNIFTRMFPEAKLRIINALKDEHQIVAMTGDGVNDGPALKAAHIGIAMGKRGSEIAKQASALVLVEDDLSKMVDAIAMGRKIYSNLKKAIQYIISIHIPIILTVALPLFFGWIYPDIFTPVHVIFLELIMGPTCSIVYENEPIEKNSMEQAPRKISFSFLNWQELRISIVQGLAITIGTLASYQVAVAMTMSEEGTRSMVFSTLIVANIFLTLVNRSFYHSVLSTVSYQNTLMRAVIAITILLLGLIIYLPILNTFFKMEPLSWSHLLIAALSGFLSVIWFEGYKFIKRSNQKNIKHAL